MRILLLLTIASLARAQDPLSGVCFSPDERCEIPLASFLSSAKSTIDVAIYDINEPGIVGAILKAQAQGVRIRIVCDKVQAAGPHSAIKKLADAGVPLRYGHQKGIMHNKFAILDGGWLETGSFNYTVHASQDNQENQLYTTDALALQRYKARFELIWAGATSVRPTPLTPAPKPQ